MNIHKKAYSSSKKKNTLRRFMRILMLSNELTYRIISMQNLSDPITYPPITITYKILEINVVYEELSMTKTEYYVKIYCYKINKRFRIVQSSNHLIQ